MATVTACAYDATYSTDSIYLYYFGSSSIYYERMADYLVGAAAFQNIRPQIALALGDLESGGPGGNWLQLDSTAVSDFLTYWSQHNNTGLTPPSSSKITSLDSLNAAAGVWWLQQKTNCGYSDWRGLISKCSSYNGICSACSCPYETAYGWSALFLAFGSNYPVSSYTYQGARYPTGPSQTQNKYLNPNCGAAHSITVPSFSVSTTVRTTPYGRNANSKQIVLLAGVAGDYISCLQMNINLQASGVMEPVVTADATFAAQAAQHPRICVIAVGAQAVSNIQSACSSLGLTCNSYSSFSAWEAGGSTGYINASGSTGTDSYNLGNSAASSAGSAGW